MALTEPWHIRSRGRECAATQRPFVSGEMIVTALFPDPESSGYLRRDYGLDAWQARAEDEEAPFSSWRTRFTPPGGNKTAPPEKENPEDILRRMVEEDADHTENTRYILAVMLERRKLLRETDTQRTPTGILRIYENRKTGEVYIVKDPNVPLSEVDALQQEVMELLEAQTHPPETAEEQESVETVESTDVEEPSETRNTADEAAPPEPPETPEPPMFLPGYKDLAKRQWIAAIEVFKLSGQMPVTELAGHLGVSYMAAKQYCEDLRKLGYLERNRAPRREVGRPEVFYRLAPKADQLFPEAGVGFSLELLEHLKTLFGESAPERLIYQYFQHQQERWLPRLAKARSLVEKATLLAGLREQAGCFGRCKYDAEKGFRIEEYHHPLAAVFARYPRAIGMELRMLEALLGTRVNRREIAGGPHGPARVDYEVATLGTA